MHQSHFIPILLSQMLGSDFPIDYQTITTLVKQSLDGDGRTAKLRRGFSLLKR